MKILVRIFSEITIKSPSVRKNLIRLLRRNLEGSLSKVRKGVQVKGGWDSIEIETQDEEKEEELFSILKNTPGIEWSAQAIEFPLKDFDDILEKVLQNLQNDLAGKTFCVRVQRAGNHSFSSLDAEKYIGGGINQKIEDSKVQLKNPDVEVSLIIKDKTVFLRAKKQRGIGGYPVGSQGKVLCLLSGGFDSGVVAHMMMNRGCKVDYLFCNLGGMAHESGVRKMANHLWKNTSASFPVKMFSVPFEPVVAELLEKTEEGLRGVLLKRMMLRSAEKIARKGKYKALITGESLGQVSSQTLQNLKVIDNATDMLILRPLTAMNKPEIIERAKKIGTADIATSMPEYCGAVSSRPSVSAKMYEVIREEEKFDMKVLEHATAETIMNIVGDFTEEDFAIPEVETAQKAEKNDVIIDVREAEECEELPLTEECTILHIPFYEVQEKFEELDQEKKYLLYCERGVVSRAQAEVLVKKGFRNVRVLRK